MNKYLEKLSSDLKKKIKRKKMPSFQQPMLATLTKNYFSDEHWIYERKLDGVRGLIFKDHDNVSLKSRNNKIINSNYPEIAEATKKLKVDRIILDGEIVAFQDKVTSFEKLQQRLGIKNAQKARATGVKIYMYVFDILYLDGYEITDLPLENRKSILKNCITFKDPIRYEIHKNKEGIRFFKEACKKGWEGIIAKNRHSKYVHKRSKNWLKFKCVANQELVIVGYTEPQGSRIGFGALLLGYYKNGKLFFAGKVGTGFNDQFLATFSKKLKKIEITENSLVNKKDVEKKRVHFVQPKYVAEIGFEEWTKDNKLRQPRFLGLREDKDPKKVIKETPQYIVPKL